MLFAEKLAKIKSHRSLVLLKITFKKRLRAREQCHVEYNKTIAEKVLFLN